MPPTKIKGRTYGDRAGIPNAPVELKIDAVRRVLIGGEASEEVARDVGYSGQSLRAWISRYEDQVRKESLLAELEAENGFPASTKAGILAEIEALRLEVSMQRALLGEITARMRG